ncbi:Regulator of nucleoside diphosphate kinase [Novipirellula aureliae]|uniref:Regulator of nucleoside diphosphate kinase n=1 Tax=Novipirellula aureliae TaxID=2527966 RepID=A0A5C6DTL4_9BACT|nr:nucleoside diphosphate kinase regulator [Novipirellula aureliae]TWU40070.1 Regulator of nucleoside diphosphate kinase [Novipirellula aureliae]
MFPPNITINKADQLRLLELLATEYKKVAGCKQHFIDLQNELRRAKLVELGQVPRDCVTMNSIVRLWDNENKESQTYTLVYPEYEDIKASRLSILSPIGTAILGSRVGDIVSWQVPIGQRHIKIEEVLYQPEREDKVA